MDTVNSRTPGGFLRERANETDAAAQRDDGLKNFEELRRHPNLPGALRSKWNAVASAF